MGILQFIFNQGKNTDAPVCPYCGITLDKFPSRKIKCLKCGEFMYVRTQPKDRKRVIVTKDQADKIEEEWSIVTGTHDQYLFEKEKVKKEKEILTKRFGKEPTENDVKWGLFNKELIENARNNNWGLYRNTRLDMGDLLKKEGKYQQTLETYLEICYLDLNGPMNGGNTRFDPTYPTAELAPGIIRYINQLYPKINIELVEVKRIFLKVATTTQQSLKLSISPEEAWDKLVKELSNNNKNNV